MEPSDSDLAGKQCVPCRGGIPPLSEPEAEKLRLKVPDWKIRKDGTTLRLENTFEFRDFVEAMKFVNRVAETAETQGHHPDLHIHWNQVGVEIWTHKIGGLHENDFILAAKINSLNSK